MHGGDDEETGDESASDGVEPVTVSDDAHRASGDDDADATPTTSTRSPGSADAEDERPEAPATADAAEQGDLEAAAPTSAPSRPATMRELVDPDEPALPDSPPAPLTTEAAEPRRPTTGAATWYRTDQERHRSVNRLANPWYRRIARGVIGLSFVAAAGIGLYFGARLVQDYLDRDRLPSAGVDVPTVRATSFEIRSTAPAPVLDGTLTLDAQTGAFEFTGRGTGQQAGIQVVSPDGTSTFVRTGASPWRVVEAADVVAADALRAVAYLRNDDSADDILTSRLRRGYVDLLERTEIGEGSAQQIRYEVRIDTANFSADFPLQYREFEERAIPGVQPVRGLLVTITLDDDEVLVGVDDMGTNWSWQRLTYTDQPFRPIDPADDLLDGSIEITDGSP